jgi:hypothetical protein
MMMIRCAISATLERLRHSLDRIVIKWNVGLVCGTSRNALAREADDEGKRDGQEVP